MPSPLSGVPRSRALVLLGVAAGAAGIGVGISSTPSTPAPPPARHRPRDDRATARPRPADDRAAGDHHHGATARAAHHDGPRASGGAGSRTDHDGDPRAPGPGPHGARRHLARAVRRLYGRPPLHRRLGRSRAGGRASARRTQGGPDRRRCAPLLGLLEPATRLLGRLLGRLRERRGGAEGPRQRAFAGFYGCLPASHRTIVGIWSDDPTAPLHEGARTPANSPYDVLLQDNASLDFVTAPKPCRIHPRRVGEVGLTRC